ncbi:galactose mutarotase-like protein [Vararia minispora EC-137]|uniref:Galactose mutarotase-like protein n=1 Tax=Vararia minispora EC-137 TaxID=1314806 RepID=A0ACB8R0K6_9AGAM|nr:galactose mutarotase-like protein [Vararia minispora EC-137]
MLQNIIFPFYLLVLTAAQLMQEPWPFDVTTISAPDGSVTAKFVSIGATMVELWVRDKHGESLDVIAGYDDSSKLWTDPSHPVFNPIVGRYANRIKNGTFSIPITRDPPANGSNVYHIPTNDHNGQDTLHGGIYGWDRRNWTIVAKSPTSVTYYHLDPADEGFPGNVSIFATHSVTSGELKTKVFAIATQKTPIMVTQHIYWNLDAFRTDSTNVSNWSNSRIFNHTLHLDASRYIETDSNGVPTGPVSAVIGTPLDFRTAQQIGARWSELEGVCGPGCQGYDNCWIYDGNETVKAGTTLWSDLSGIRLDIFTNQPAVQVYTSNYFGLPRKVVHGGPSLVYAPQSAVAIEQEGWIDAINNPEWDIDQIYGPGKDFFWETTYKFSLI